MANIVAANIVEDRRQADGRRRIRYELTDKVGKRYYVHKLVPVGFDTTVDLTVEQARWETLLADREIEEMKNRLREGINPLRDAQNNPVNPTYADRNTAIRRVVRELVAEEDPRDFIKAVPFFANLTDVQLKALFGITQARVDALRAKWAALVEAKTRLDSWTPEEL